MDKTHQNSQNVIDMSDFQPETGYTAIAQVEAYWEAIRGNRLLPKRSDIDPRGIEQALEHAFILERIAPGVARIRLAGSHLNELMGMESRGMPLTAFFTPAARPTVSDLLEQVFQAPGTAQLILGSAKSIGRPALDARLLLLPLQSDLGDVSRVLGCFVAKGKIGASPRRFDVLSHSMTTLINGERIAPAPMTPPAPAPRPAPPAPVPGLAEAPTSFVPKADTPKTGKPTKRPPYLRLIKSDD